MGNALWSVEKNAGAILLKLKQSEDLILVCLAKVNYSCTGAGKWPRADSVAFKLFCWIKKNKVRMWGEELGKEQCKERYKLNKLMA